MPVSYARGDSVSGSREDIDHNVIVLSTVDQSKCFWWVVSTCFFSFLNFPGIILRFAGH